MTNKLTVIINSLKVPKIKKILLYEMKFLVPNYSCLQKPWLGGYRPRSPFCLSCVLNWICWTPLHLRTKFLAAPLRGITWPPKTMNQLPSATTSQLRRTQSPSTPLWKPRDLQFEPMWKQGSWHGYRFYNDNFLLGLKRTWTICHRGHGTIKKLLR